MSYELDPKFDLVARYQTKMSLLHGSNGSQQFHRDVAEQKAFESQFVASYRACSPSPSLINLNSREVWNLATTQFYNGEVLKAIECLITSVTSDPEKIREYFGPLKPLNLNQPSSSGYVFQSFNISRQHLEKYATNLFIIKVPKVGWAYDEIIHECAVAFLATNHLREIGIPNFAYVYGAFMCSPPFIDEEKQAVATYCNRNLGAPGNSVYAVYENIPGPSFREFNDSHPDIQLLMDYYLQTMMAVKCAYESSNFTHYDLHDSNILIRPFRSSPFLIRYPTRTPSNESGYTYVKSPGGIATIIDYGRSHIRTPEGSGAQPSEGKHLGSPIYLGYTGITRDQANPLWDAYKLFTGLMFPFYPATIQPSIPELADLMKFFEGITEKPMKNPNYAIYHASQHHYQFPTNDLTTFDKFVEWIETCRQWCVKMGLHDPILGATLSPEDAQLPIYGCASEEKTSEGEACDLRPAVYQKLLNTPDPVSFDINHLVAERLTYRDLYDISKTLSDADQNLLIERLRDPNLLARLNMDEMRYIAGLMKPFNPLLAKLSQHLERLPAEYPRLMTESQLQTTKTFTNDVAQFCETLHQLIRIDEELAFIRDTYRIDNPQFLGVYQNLHSKISHPDVATTFETLKTAVMEDIQRLDFVHGNINALVLHNQAMEPRNNRFLYYWTSFAKLSIFFT